MKWMRLARLTLSLTLIAPAAIANGSSGAPTHVDPRAAAVVQSGVARVAAQRQLNARMRSNGLRSITRRFGRGTVRAQNPGVVGESTLRDFADHPDPEVRAAIANTLRVDQARRAGRGVGVRTPGQAALTRRAIRSLRGMRALLGARAEGAGELGAIESDGSRSTTGVVRATFTANETENMPGELVRTETSQPSGDGDTDRAHERMLLAHNVVTEVYGVPEGLNPVNNVDVGNALVSTAHINPGPSTFRVGWRRLGNRLPQRFRERIGYNNAFFTGKGDHRDQMAYGSGFKPFRVGGFTHRDVVTHELGHAEQQYIFTPEGIDYQHYAGGFNEHWADFSGKMAVHHELAKIGQLPAKLERKDWDLGGPERDHSHATNTRSRSRSARAKIAVAKWLPGSNVFEDGIMDGKGEGPGALRNMLEPGTGYTTPTGRRDRQPASFEQVEANPAQYDEPHALSGPFNRAMALTANAVDGQLNGGQRYMYTLGPVLAYANTLLTSTTPTPGEVRDATMRAAREVWAHDPATANALTAALEEGWKAVQVDKAADHQVPGGDAAALEAASNTAGFRPAALLNRARQAFTGR